MRARRRDGAESRGEGGMAQIVSRRVVWQRHRRSSVYAGFSLTAGSGDT
jgi:hypothetical protein